MKIYKLCCLLDFVNVVGQKLKDNRILKKWIDCISNNRCNVKIRCVMDCCVKISICYEI